MKKLELGRTINTIANLGVIAGIIFLALELNQNNQLRKKSTHPMVPFAEPGLGPPKAPEPPAKIISHPSLSSSSMKGFSLRIETLRDRYFSVPPAILSCGPG
jgi:hypothetical protein